MRRRTLAAAALVLLAASPARAAAQLGVKVGEDWNLTIAGNVNAFLVHERERLGGQITSPLAAVGIGRHGTSVRTGFLPAFLVFDLRGREDSTDLGVHFGLAPQIQGSGTRLEMRQAYLVAGGGWGRLLAGREIGLFGRQSLLTDQSIFGIGAAGGNFGDPSGPALGHAGFGYIYPNFSAQLTYSLPGSGPLALSVGLFDPGADGVYTELDFPRLESELSWTARGTTLWAAGLAQAQRAPAGEVDAAAGRGAVAWGTTAGVKQVAGPLTFVASGFVGRGIGTRRLFEGAVADSAAGLRPSHGWMAQLAWRPHGERTTLSASYGRGILAAGTGDAPFRLANSAFTTGIYHTATRALRFVGEGTLARTDDDDPATRPNGSVTVAAGVMLFF